MVMTVLVLIFAEVMPKTYAIANPESLASVVARPMSLVMKVLSPIVMVVRALRARASCGCSGCRPIPMRTCSRVHEEIAGALTIGHESGTVEKEDRDRLLGALDLGNRTRRGDHEAPLGDPDDRRRAADPATILDAVLSSPHTRLPVYKGANARNVVGVDPCQGRAARDPQIRL